MVTLFERWFSFLAHKCRSEASGLGGPKILKEGETGGVYCYGCFGFNGDELPAECLKKRCKWLSGREQQPGSCVCCHPRVYTVVDIGGVQFCPK